MVVSVIIYLWLMKLVWDIESIIQSTENLFNHLKQEEIEAAQIKLKEFQNAFKEISFFAEGHKVKTRKTEYKIIKEEENLEQDD